MVSAATLRHRGTGAFLAGLSLLSIGPSPILSQEEAVASPDAFTVPGKVADAETGEPIQYAVVGIPELATWGLSESDGSFSLEVAAAGTYHLVVVKRGWYLAGAEVTLTGPKELAINLYKEEEGDPVGSGRLVGRVVEAGSTKPVSGATVRITPTNQETRTDSRGRFIVSNISAGAVLVEVEHKGSVLRSDTLATFPGVTLGVEMGVSDDPSAKPQTTVEIWPQYLESMGFYRRAESRKGSQFGRVFLEEQRSTSRLTDIIDSAVLSLRAETGRFGNRVITARGTGGDRCALGIYLDGSYMPGFDIDTYPLSALEAFETYERFDVPPEYANPCGVILLWSRRPR